MDLTSGSHHWESLAETRGSEWSKTMGFIPPRFPCSMWASLLKATAPFEALSIQLSSQTLVTAPTHCPFGPKGRVDSSPLLLALGYCNISC